MWEAWLVRRDGEASAPPHHGLNTGGAERTLVTLLRALDRSRFELGVVSLLAGGVLAPKVRELGLPLWSSACRAPRPRGAIRLARVLGEFRPTSSDLMSTRSPRPPRRARAPRPEDPLEHPLLRHGRHAVQAPPQGDDLGCSALSRFADGVVVNSWRGREVHDGLGYRPASASMAERHRPRAGTARYGERAGTPKSASATSSSSPASPASTR